MKQLRAVDSMTDEPLFGDLYYLILGFMLTNAYLNPKPLIQLIQRIYVTCSVSVRINTQAVIHGLTNISHVLLLCSLKCLP